MPNQYLITVDINEAARMLGIKSTSRVAAKAKAGLIPGAFKAGLRWMFILEMLVDHIRQLENTNREVAQVDITRKVEKKICHLAKRKTARIGIPGSLSAESECRSQLAALFDQTRRNTKTSVRRKSENRSYSVKNKDEPGQRQLLDGATR